MKRTLRTLTIACATGLLLAGAAIGPADAHGGGGGGGAHVAGGMAHPAVGHSIGGGHVAHMGGHYGHGFHRGRFFAGIGNGFYFDDYAYPDYAYDDGGGCGYARQMWHRTGRPYWRHRYDACLSG
jgi:hypothetical protein